MKKRKQLSSSSQSTSDSCTDFDNRLVKDFILNRKSAFKFIRPSIASIVNHPSVKNMILMLKPRDFKLDKNFKIEFYKNNEDNYGIPEKAWLLIEILKTYRQNNNSVKEEFTSKQLIANSYYKLITDLSPREVFNITNCDKGYSAAYKYYPLWAKVSFILSSDSDLNCEKFPCLKKFLGDLAQNVHAPKKFKFNSRFMNEFYDDIQKDNHTTILLTCIASMAKLIEKLPDNEKYEAISTANRCVSLYSNPRCTNTNGILQAFFDKYLPSKNSNSVAANRI